MDKGIPKEERLRLMVIYTSVQGARTWVGLGCVFNRVGRL